MKQREMEEKKQKIQRFRDDMDMKEWDVMYETYKKMNIKLAEAAVRSKNIRDM